ncbi:hypothetical protein ACRVZA_15680 [Bacillus velezensis]|nr:MULTISPECIES: hypothetical protein [Bacillus]ANF35341.1 hypothetical protein BCBMB205_04360 [Bacillus velezensis]ARZ56760.1 hypothetical protein BAGQ_0491 [Bacillus velezensis]MCS3380904.1 hypothetical protein [Bacillus velezensis]MCT7288568.1 hypothetical protein [Bacillus velezensis]MCX2811783.1 hypothetical protein [Bacillus sp. ChL18]
MKKVIISSALIAILFTGLLSVTNVYTAEMSDSGTFHIAEKAINI